MTEKIRDRIIVMGGSFNPPTKAHFLLMSSALDALGAGRGFYVPVSNAYLNRKMRDEHPPVILDTVLRVRMLEEMCRMDSRMEVCNAETGAVQVRTVEMMDYIQAEYPDAELFFLMGADKLPLLRHLCEKSRFLDKYKVALFARNGDNAAEDMEADEIMRGYTGSVAIVPSPEGIEHISSTEVRRLMLASESSETLLYPCVWELFRKCRAEDFPDRIIRFKDEYSFLANSYPCRIMWKGRHFTNADSAYKSEDSAGGPEQAMELIIREKFNQNPSLKAKLLATKGKILINGGSNKNTFWGVDTYSWEGENKLGIILMKIRDEEL